jgi:F-type H+-transporting ATPase subunit b
VIELNIAFVVQLFNFLLLLIILNIFLYKPLRKVLAERRQVIELAKEKTASVDQEVQEKMRLYESRLREVKADAMARRAEAIKQAQLKRRL